MASRDANILRFAVGNRDDLHSSVWRLWASGNDFYLAARSHASISKFSFHQTGKKTVRYAIHSTTPRPALVKWSPPGELFPGWTIAFAILVPPRITSHPFHEALRDNKPVQYIAPPQPGTKAVFQIALSDIAAQEEDMMRLPADKKISVHGRIEMRREAAWLVSFYDTFTPQEQSTVTDDFNKIKIHLKPGSTCEGMLAFAHSIETGTRPFLTEIQLGRENLDISL